jgi:hypothetical protein
VHQQQQAPGMSSNFMPARVHRAIADLSSDVEAYFKAIEGLPLGPYTLLLLLVLPSRCRIVSAFTSWPKDYTSIIDSLSDRTSQCWIPTWDYYNKIFGFRVPSPDGDAKEILASLRKNCSDPYLKNSVSISQPFSLLKQLSFDRTSCVSCVCVR